VDLVIIGTSVQITTLAHPKILSWLPVTFISRSSSSVGYRCVLMCRTGKRWYLDRPSHTCITALLMMVYVLPIIAAVFKRRHRRRKSLIDFLSAPERTKVWLTRFETPCISVCGLVSSSATAAAAAASIENWSASWAGQMTEQTAFDGHCQQTDRQQVRCRWQYGSAAAARMSTSRHALRASLIRRLRGSPSSKAAAARQTVSDSVALRRQHADEHCQRSDAIATAAGNDALTLSHRSNCQHSAESSHKLVSHCSFLLAPSNNCVVECRDGNRTEPKPNEPN